MQWLRWWHGTVNDPKFSWVARKAGCNVATVIAVWAALLEHASQEDERGTLGGFDPESYDCTLGLDDGTCQRVMDAMRGKGLLEVDRVAMWESRQSKPDKSAERMQRYREKLKTQSEEEESKTEEDTDTEGDTLRNVTVTSRNVTARRASKVCPSEFAITDEMRAWAATECPGIDLDRETATFKDYTFASAKTNWLATWRNWMRKAKPINGSRPTRYEELRKRAVSWNPSTPTTNPLLIEAKR